MDLILGIPSMMQGSMEHASSSSLSLFAVAASSASSAQHEAGPVNFIFLAFVWLLAAFEICLLVSRCMIGLFF